MLSQTLGHYLAYKDESAWKNKPYWFDILAIASEGNKPDQYIISMGGWEQPDRPLMIIDNFKGIYLTSTDQLRLAISQQLHRIEQRKKYVSQLPHAVGMTFFTTLEQAWACFKDEVELAMASNRFVSLEQLQTEWLIRQN